MKDSFPFEKLRAAMQKDETRIVLVSGIGISAMSGLILFQFLV